MQSFNNWLALKITNGVATMYCAYLFAVIALVSLPAAIASHSLMVLISWLAQTFLQLVLLSIILVGQKLQTRTIESHKASHDGHFIALHRKLDLISNYLGTKHLEQAKKHEDKREEII